MDRLRLRTCTVDLPGLRVLHDSGEEVVLSAREGELLRRLAERPGETVDRRTLETEILGLHSEVVSRALDALVRRLRNKIEADPLAPRHLLTLRGEGFRFEPLPTAGDVPTVWVAVAHDAPERVAAAREREGGVLLLREGDEHVLSFATAAPAARFCLALTDAGGRGSAGVGPDPSRVRRMLAVGAPGVALFDRRLYDEVAAATGVRERSWRALGAVRLGRDPMREVLFATGGNGPDLLSANGNLVAPPSSLIGREDERARVAALLGPARPVTLTGTGGIGKTRLALELGRVWRETDAGAWFCDLSAARSADEVRSAVVGALGIPLHACTDLAEALAALAGDLVVFDNAEQVIPAVRDLLARVPGGVCVLVTSRERLSLPGEQVVELGRLSTDDGVRLFRRCTQALGVPDSDPDPIRGIVERVEGLPLAIELAATRTEILDPAALLVRLERRLLEVGSDTARVPRHADLRVLVRWSWDLLSPAEQEVLTVCAVFAGSFRVEDIEAVVDRPSVDALQALRRKGLLRAAPIRLALHAAVRAFVLEAAEPGAIADARDRHARWFARWGGPALDDRLSAPDGIELLARLTDDLPDLRLAIEHALPRDPALAAELFTGAALGMAHQGFAEWVERYARRVLPYASDPELVHRRRLMQGTTREVAREVEDALVESRNPRTLAARLRVAWQLGEQWRCETLVDEAVTAARTAGDEVALLRALAWGAGFWFETGQAEVGTRALNEALALAQRRGDSSEELSARLRLALAACYGGEYDRARNESRAASALAAGLHPRGRLSALAVRSTVHLARAELEALAVSEAVVAESRRCGDADSVLQYLLNVAASHASFTSTAAARRIYDEVVREAGTRGSVPYLVWGRAGLAETDHAEGDLDGAIEGLTRAIERLEATGVRVSVGPYLALRGDARSRRGERGALEDLDRAVHVAATGHRPAAEARALGWRALAQGRLGDARGATIDLERAAALAVRLRPGSVPVALVLVRAELLVLAGDLRSAADLCRQARAELEHLRMPPPTVLGRWLERLDAQARRPRAGPLPTPP